MPGDFKKLNKKRSEGYRKPDAEESFLEELNHFLEPREQQLYKEDEPIEHPFIFVIGLPRSGTTLLSQVIAHGLQIAYINNITARFWEAPLHGMKLSDALLDREVASGYSSEYASTESLSGIHEFGYFWRKWLHKETFDSIVNAAEYESKIDWQGLKTVLVNMQAYKKAGFVFKNIYGSHHIARLDELLEKTLWVYIDRDILDVAVSNLKAREKFYDNPATWWSSVPPEYNKLKDLEVIPQIAGQLHYLKKFYVSELNRLKKSGNGLWINYNELCSGPNAFLERIQDRVKSLFNYELKRTGNTPSSFPANKYTGEDELKKEFESHLSEFQKKDPIPDVK